VDPVSGQRGPFGSGASGAREVLWYRKDPSARGGR